MLLLINAAKGEFVDHIDGNGLNNCKANLRICTPFQNCCNRGKYRGNSRYKGVSWHRVKKRWIACITVNRRYIALGSFVDEREAAKAYNVAAQEYFGEFAWLNML